ncbi:hypothetical protein D3C72_2147000 [compost metagenome]
MTDAALAGRIARHQAPTKEGQHRCGVDDAAARGLELATHRSAHTHGACQVHFQHALEDFDIVLFSALDDARAVEHDIERGQIGQHAVQIVLLRHIGLAHFHSG